MGGAEGQDEGGGGVRRKRPVNRLAHAVLKDTCTGLAH
jgi:hypothetical protein